MSMETQQEPTKADAVVAPPGVAGEPAGGSGVLDSKICVLSFTYSPVLCSLGVYRWVIDM